jgi:hypothetical protein
MRPAEIHRHVCQAFDTFVQHRIEGHGPPNWDVRRADLAGWIRGLDASVAFAGLLSILESESRYQYQDLAGELLTRGGIPCPLALPEFMRRAFSLWNPSASSVPRYAAQVFGREVILNFIRANQTVDLDQPKREAVQYWLGEHPAKG